MNLVAPYIRRGGVDTVFVMVYTNWECKYDSGLIFTDSQTYNHPLQVWPLLWNISHVWKQSSLKLII